MMSWLRKGKKTAAGTVRRITGISTPLGGVQLAPPAPTPDTSFGRAQDERELLDEIWFQAVSEAYGAKDAARRLQEMQGQTRLAVIESYFGANPEIKRWADRNIDAGTCAAAVSELREKREQFQQWKQEQRGKEAPPVPRDPAFDWLRQAARGSDKGRLP
jgi:hypothetical protein